MTQKYRLRGDSVEAEFVPADGYSAAYVRVNLASGDFEILSEGEFNTLFEQVPDDQGLTKDNGDE